MLCLELDLKSTLECGQVFRYIKNEEGYTIFSKDKMAVCRQNGSIAEIQTANEAYFYHYFDAETNYTEIMRELSDRDSTMRAIIPHMAGLRILRQDLWETTISFLISQNNFIPRIRSIIEKLCEGFGERMDGYHAFPAARTLSSKTCRDLQPLKCGYRDQYILNAAQKYAENSLDLHTVLFADCETAKAELKKIKGVGNKVANCILLFGGGHREAFPVDTWMYKTLSQVYGIDKPTEKEVTDFSNEKFGCLAGYAQQYLFYAARENMLTSILEGNP